MRALALSLILATAAASARAELSGPEVALETALHARAPAMRTRLERFVASNTGTWNLAGLEAFAGELREALSSLGFAVEVEPGGEVELPDRGRSRTGPLVVARRPGEGPRLLLVGHYDTVFEPGSTSAELRVDPGRPGRAVGPGASDMKGGLVVLLEALRALAEAGDLGRASWTVLLNADEEIGSPASRARIEAESRRADAGFVFEAAREAGEMVRSRRGVGQIHLRVQGVSAHAGSDHAAGRSAVRELARQILAVEALTDYGRGITLNAGRVEGGTKRNVVPGHATAWIDLRYERPEDGEAVVERIETIARKGAFEGTHTRVWAALHRPPKPETAGTRRLLALHGEVARDLGLEARPPVHAGGGTDGSLMGAAGLPTLDSMGVRGGEAHTEREFVVLESLPERAALAAILLRRLLYGARVRPAVTPRPRGGRFARSAPDGDRWVPGRRSVREPRQVRKEAAAAARFGWSDRPSDLPRGPAASSKWRASAARSEAKPSEDIRCEVPSPP